MECDGTYACRVCDQRYACAYTRRRHEKASRVYNCRVYDCRVYYAWVASKGKQGTYKGKRGAVTVLLQ